MLVTTVVSKDEEDTETPGGVEDSAAGGGVVDAKSSSGKFSTIPSVLVGWVDEETSVKTKSVPGKFFDGSSFVSSTDQSESEINDFRSSMISSHEWQWSI